MKPGLVSVVIPVYNGSRYLRQAVDSVLAQTYPDVEVMAVDDGSTDDSAAILEGYGEKVRVYRQANCGNVGQVRNTGIERSEGEFIAFLDQDDWWRPEKLQRQIQAVRSDGRIALVHTAVVHFEGDSDREVPPLNPKAQPERLGGSCYDRLLLGNAIYNSSVLVRRSALLKVGMCDGAIEGNTVQDYDLWLRIAAEYALGFVDAPVTCYRMHGGQGMWDRRAMLEAELALLLRVRSRTYWIGETQRRRRLAQLYDQLAVAHLDRGDELRARRCFRAAAGTLPSLRQVSRYACSLLPRRIVAAVRQRRRANAIHAERPDQM